MLRHEETWIDQRDEAEKERVWISRTDHMELVIDD